MMVIYTRWKQRNKHTIVNSLGFGIQPLFALDYCPSPDYLCGTMKITSSDEERFISEAGILADAYRPQCLWFLKEDFHPQNTESAMRILSYIEKYGDRLAFEKANSLKK